MSDTSQLLTQLLLSLIKKFETDKQVIVDSVGILRVLLQRFSKFVFGSLKLYLQENQQNNTILISYAALLPQLLNVTQQESLQLSNQIRIKLSEQDFLSPVTNGILSLVDTGKFQFLDSQKYFDDLHNNYINRICPTSKQQQEPLIHPQITISQNVINLVISLQQLAEQLNPEALQIFAAISIKSTQILQIFIKILQNSTAQKLNQQQYEQILEIICYFTVKTNVLNSEILRVFQQFLRSELLQNCSLLAQLHISRICQIIVQNRNLVQNKFLGDIFSYLHKAVININQLNNFEIFDKIKKGMESQQFNPMLTPQIQSSQPPPVQNKLVRSFIIQILFNISLLSDFDGFQQEIYDLLFEIKIVNSISVYRLLAGDIIAISEKSIFFMNLMKSGARDPQWRCRKQSFLYFNQNFTKQFYVVPQRLDFPYFESKKLVSETLLTDSDVTVFQCLVDPVNIIQQLGITLIQQQYNQLFNDTTPLQFQSYLTQNIQQYIQISNSVYQPSEKVLFALQVARCCAMISKILRHSTNQFQSISSILSDISRDFYQCVCCVYSFLEERGGPEWKGEVLKIEKEGSEV
ncbi:hypothetical protein SS50377_26320 [Spironucleus salmonicida]|nr:hypothetical protein SS50377_26320 [Spironucleus salmonicida]